MILPTVFLQSLGSIVLVAQVDVVYHLDAALPVPCKQVGSRGMDLILPPYEVPHEVPPVHPSQLEIEEV